MQHSGFKLFTVFLIILFGACTSSADDLYHEVDMAKLSTLVRTTMSIVKGEYYGRTIPSRISEDDIVQMVRAQNSRHFKELEQIDGNINLEIVSNGSQIGAIVWDSNNNRKLIQDLQCTLILDDPAYQRKEFGNEFSLDWNKCSVQEVRF